MANEGPPPAAPLTGTATPEDADPGQPPAATQKMRRGDAWLIWGVSLGAIAVPVIILLTIDSLQTDSWRWNGVAAAFDHGDFLVPVLILIADTIRRLWREAACSGWLLVGFRILATIVCTVFCIACFAGIVVATETTSPTERTAVAQLTLSALVVALAFGTVAVGLPAREAAQQ
jgi:hypothetical protein